MKSYLKPQIDSISGIRFQKVTSLFIFGLFFVLVAFFSPMGKAFQFNPDEGRLLMKGFLHAHGHLLYKEIWMDQPPFLLLLVSAMIKNLTSSVYAARLLVLLFSTVLLWGFFRIICKALNAYAALFAVVVLMLSPYYLELSISVMAGLPAIALAVLSFFCINLYQEKYLKRYLFLSGGLFALALMSKYFVIVFMPGLLIELMMDKNRKSFYPVLGWAISLIAVYCLVAFWAGGIDYSQIIQPYFKLKKGGVLNHFRGVPFVKHWIVSDFDIALLALGGIVFLREEKRRHLIFPLSSFIFAVFIFSIHSPIWVNHRLLVSVPLYWLASFGVFSLFDNETLNGWRLKNESRFLRDGAAVIYLTIVLVFVLFRLPFRYADMMQQISDKSPKEYYHALDLIKKYAKETHLVLTDSPIFAYYAKLPIDPHMGTVTTRMLMSKVITYRNFVDTIRQQKPEVVLFAFFPNLNDQVSPYLEDSYKLIYKNNGEYFLRLYILTKICNS